MKTARKCWYDPRPYPEGFLWCIRCKELHVEDTTTRRFHPPSMSNVYLCLPCELTYPGGSNKRPGSAG